MDPVELIVYAAKRQRALPFTVPSADALRAAAERFDTAIRNHPLKHLRHLMSGYGMRADIAVRQHDAAIDEAICTLGASGVQSPIPAELLRAVLYVETRYNHDIRAMRHFSTTAGPMNINLSLWKQVIEDFSHNHPELGLSIASARNHAPHNILAGALILSTINASVDPAITGPARMAMIASLYGNTEASLRANSPIPYGAKVAAVLQERFPLPRAAPLPPIAEALALPEPSAMLVPRVTAAPQHSR